MRRINVWVLVPAVLLALGVGVLVGRAGDDDNETASDRSASARTTTSTTEDTTTTVTEDTTTTTASATTTTAAAGGTSTTVRASAPATQTSTETTLRTATSDSACGPGTAGVSAQIVVTGSGPPTSPTFTYSGPVTVTNNTGKAIELTSLVLRLVSEDGTVEDVAVNGAVGTVIASGASKDLPFSYSTSHPPKQGGTSIGRFSYKAPGGTNNCAST